MVRLFMILSLFLSFVFEAWTISSRGVHLEPIPGPRVAAMVRQ